jgi:hypothetical protein
MPEIVPYSTEAKKREVEELHAEHERLLKELKAAKAAVAKRQRAEQPPHSSKKHGSKSGD